ncbi:MAG TPA: TetR/AcrR family transcriptional regulator C-terminal domain-containing protein [Pseudonocardiaceae bacterium]|jgi:AcrR family transcriptional regulator|nr:TetR/AcrR family transcriptional regulator C-terminal domain-containing protein [Pseudonocardiaceae bacterium]
MPRPAQIDRDSVLVAALAIADADGVAGLSMRAVAERLGVTAMALYRHVGDKQELLDGLVERLLLELPLPDPALSWQDRLAAMAAAMRQTARAHPQVFPLLLQRPAATSGARRVRDAVYRALRDAGAPEDLVPRIERVLSTFALGFAASEAAGRFSVEASELDLDLAWFSECVLNALSGRRTAQQ